MLDVILIVIANWLPRRLVLYVIYRVINHSRKFNDCRVGLTTITAEQMIIEWREVMAGAQREARA